MNTYLFSSFNKIYPIYYRKAFLFAKSYVHDNFTAEDLASEALIKLWEIYQEGQIDNSLPLLLTILRNKILDYFKHEEVKLRVANTMLDWQERERSILISSLESCDPQNIYSKEITQIINETLMTLPEQTRHIFILSRIKNKQNKEIAIEMNLSVKAVEYHLTKALKALRIALKDYLPFFYFFFFNC